MRQQTKSFKQHLLLAILLIASGVASAQVCNRESIAETVGVENPNYLYDADPIGPGSLQDTHFHLAWKRCFYGQTWNAASQDCLGSPQKADWKSALQIASTEGWRLPNVKELLSILDYQCFAPPLNPTMFPDAPASLSSGIWTSSPMQTSVTTQDPKISAWIIELGNGKLMYQHIEELNFILLVKDI